MKKNKKIKKNPLARGNTPKTKRLCQQSEIAKPIMA